MDEGWSVKKMVRRIAMSRTYRLSAGHTAGSYKSDPDNRLYWRMTTRRLEAEAIRDGIMSAAGTLNLEPPVGSASGAVSPRPNRTNYTVKEIPHRSVYLGMPRGAALPEAMSVFDIANPNLVVAQREVTTVPAQALFLMNSPFMREQAGKMAQRVLDAANLDGPGRVDLAFTLAVGRPATARERDRVLTHLGKDASSAGWASVCHALLASAEFRYLN
jgi:hypothetical protein